VGIPKAKSGGGSEEEAKKEGQGWANFGYLTNHN
jgi:hypothetical protein